MRVFAEKPYSAEDFNSFGGFILWEVVSSFRLDENARFFFLDTIVLCDSSRYVSRSLFLHSHFLKRQSAIKFHRPVSAERVPIVCVPLLWFTVTHNKLHAISLRVSTTRYAYGYSYRRNWSSFDNKKKNRLYSTSAYEFRMLLFFFSLNAQFTKYCELIRIFFFRKTPSTRKT